MKNSIPGVPGRFMMFLLLLVCAKMQAQFHEDLSDGELSNDPAWSGDIGKFSVVDSVLFLSDTFQTGHAYLVTSSFAVDDARWEILHRYPGNPSASNYAEFYLVSDQPDLSGPLNGYLLRIGGQSGSDDNIRLIRQAGSERSEIAGTAPGDLLNANSELSVRIVVTRNAQGNWFLSYDPEGGSDLGGAIAVFDNVHRVSRFAGLRLRYTATRASGSFQFDDINVTGQGTADTSAPLVVQLSILTGTVLELKFSEAVEPGAAADISNYHVNNGIGFPQSAELLQADLVRLEFSSGFTSGQRYELSVSGISDLHGNTGLLTIHEFIYYQPEQVSFNDVVISEIHADPDPITALPEAEFLELHNPTQKAFQTRGWTLRDGSGSDAAVFPASILPPGSFTVICSRQHIGEFGAYGSVIGLDPWPSLNNSGDEIVLRDSARMLIHHLAYSDQWYRDNLKREGGWSLEMMDVHSPCAEQGNWSASVHPDGGTPGRPNSVVRDQPDTQPPDLAGVEVPEPGRLRILFNEKVRIVPGTLPRIQAEPSIQVDTIFLEEPWLDRVSVLLTEVLDSNIIYTARVTGLGDCSGNLLQSGDSVVFGLPVPCRPGDIRINEILFNPSTGGVDYIELYNTSSDLLSVADLIIAESDPGDTAAILDFSALNEYSRLIFPHGFLLLSSSSAIVQQQYHTPAPGSFLDVGDLPNYPDDEGVVTLLRKDLRVLDQVAYSREWHYALLDDVNGVSLERIDPHGRPDARHNWHSAPSSVGFGTPGYMNASAFSPETAGDISVVPRVFSPDGDGFEDFSMIAYSLEHPGFTGNIRIFDSNGRQIRHLVRNETMGIAGMYRWDGENDRGERAVSGLYTILVDLFDLEGRRKKFHLEVALTTR